jgi:hypothetical protein
MSLPFLLTPCPENLKFGLAENKLEAKGEKLMADKVISFTDQEQMQIEGIVIDKNGMEALRFLADLLDRLKGHPGHACGLKPA